MIFHICQNLKAALSILDVDSILTQLNLILLLSLSNIKSFEQTKSYLVFLWEGDLELLKGSTWSWTGSDFPQLSYSLESQ